MKRILRELSAAFILPLLEDATIVESVMFELAVRKIIYHFAKCRHAGVDNVAQIEYNISCQLTIRTFLPAKTESLICESESIVFSVESENRPQCHPGDGLSWADANDIDYEFYIDY